MNICLYGASSNEIDKSYISATERLGTVMAKRGHSLVFGGGGSGLMGAAARGVQCKANAAKLMREKIYEYKPLFTFVHT